MPTRSIRYLILLSGIALAGCATNYQAAKVQENVWKHWASIGLTSEKINDHEYRIVALGAGASREEDIILAWNEFAVKIANGRTFTKDFAIESYTYRDTMAPGEFHAQRAVGKILIVAQK